jgi:proton-translocating NAD(P)+ transhydrogenase subunit beta
MDFNMELLIWIAYLGAALLVILGLKFLYSTMAEIREIGATEKKKDDAAPEASDSAIALATAESVIIVPGYGMAIAQAQHKVWELCKVLQKKSVRVSFAINPVAGRMPGHMDILLAEAGVPYDVIYDLENINDQFPTCDVALLIGANDIVNPAARNDDSSPIYGMPIFDAAEARKVFVIKRGQGTGFAGIENLLFSEDNARMCYGDAKDEVQKLITDIESL